MATPKVIGLSPITFASEDPATLGQEYQIPLSALKFDANGALDASDWPPIKDNKLKPKDVTLVPLLLADLLKRGVLSASST
jgi:hypothetical protein